MLEAECFVQTNYILTLKLPVLARRVSLIPPHITMIGHEAPVRKRFRVVVALWYKNPSLNIELIRN